MLKLIKRVTYFKCNPTAYVQCFLFSFLFLTTQLWQVLGMLVAILIPSQATESKNKKKVAFTKSLDCSQILQILLLVHRRSVCSNPIINLLKKLTSTFRLFDSGHSLKMILWKLVHWDKLSQVLIQAMIFLTI